MDDDLVGLHFAVIFALGFLLFSGLMAGETGKMNDIASDVCENNDLGDKLSYDHEHKVIVCEKGMVKYEEVINLTGDRYEQRKCR